MYRQNERRRRPRDVPKHIASGVSLNNSYFFGFSNLITNISEVKHGRLAQLIDNTHVYNIIRFGYDHKYMQLRIIICLEYIWYIVLTGYGSFILKWVK